MLIQFLDEWEESGYANIMGCFGGKRVYKDDYFDSTPTLGNKLDKLIGCDLYSERMWDSEFADY